MKNQSYRIRKMPKAWLIIAVLIILGVIISLSMRSPTPIHQSISPIELRQTVANICGSNTLPKLIIVSIGKRHLWACNGKTRAFDSAVVTGMENLPADLTPTGTYHIYAKQTDLYLDGSDSTGSWHDHAYYWMPFLNNQYGTYGFHDATWRTDKDFGNIDPNSDKASHGCVELPLITAIRLYDWSDIGTTIIINP